MFTLAGATTGTAIFPKLFKKTQTYIKGQEYFIKSFKTAKSELQSLQFEKSLVSQAITRVYEAVQEGKVDKTECDRLLLKYKHQLAFYDEKIDALQPLVDFAEVSDIRNDTVALLERRIAAMDQKLAELRKKSGMSPTDISKTIKMMQQQQPNIENENQESKDKGGGEEEEEELTMDDILISEKFKTKQEEQVAEGRSEEKSIEKLQKEVMEALSRLEQIEIDDKLPNSQHVNASTLNDKSCLRQFR